MYSWDQTGKLISSSGFHTYSGMQSDGNNFFGDVVLDSFNISYRDEDSILYINMLRSLLWRFKILELIEENAYIRNTAHKELIKLGFRATVVLVGIFIYCYKELKSS